MENINEGDKLFLFTDKNNEESVLKIKRLTDGDSKLAEPNKKFCILHNIIKATCALCDITTCFKCLFSNKESIDHYYEHFDSIDKSFEIINLKDKEDPLVNFEK